MTPHVVTFHHRCTPPYSPRLTLDCTQTRTRTFHYPYPRWLLPSEDLGKLVIWASGAQSRGSSSAGEMTFWEIVEIAWRRLQAIEKPAELLQARLNSNGREVIRTCYPLHELLRHGCTVTSEG